MEERQQVPRWVRLLLVLWPIWAAAVAASLLPHWWVPEAARRGRQGWTVTRVCL